jgi:glutathione S-transferase
VEDLRLITIPISHFCEKARWALELAQLPYREEPHLQVIHSAHTWRAGRGLTAPVLITPKGPLRESSQIVRFADAHAGLGLYRKPLAAALEASFDHHLGPDARTWMYHRLLGHDELIYEYGTPGVPRWERAGMPVMLPMVKSLVARRTNADDAHAEAARDRVRQVFDEVAARLDDGRPYLCGDAFSAADLAFAALSAAVTCPPRYGVALPQPDELPEPYAAEVREMREHPAGRFALRLYDQERP